jgi:DNA polymerase-1
MTIACGAVHKVIVSPLARAIVMDALASLVKEGMRSALELEVPIVVDVGIGDNWLEAH